LKDRPRPDSAASPPGPDRRQAVGYLPSHIDLDQLEADLAASVAETGDSFVREVTLYAISSGGKRLRPAIVLLCASTGPDGPAGAGKARPLAVAAELLHTATLVHDDVIDRAATRRGQPAVAAKWDDSVAILTGDFLFSRAMTIVAELGRPDISVAFGRVVQEICEAELIQLRRTFDLEYSEADYLDVVRRKSALLIAECCRSGAALVGAPAAVCDRLWTYGESMGIAFQIADDLLDLMAASQDVGKPTGNDIELGLLTLPVLRALQESPELRGLLERRLSEPGDVKRAVALVRQSDGIEYARGQAAALVNRAVDALAVITEGPTRDALAALAGFVVKRGF